jgi:hypothetical protein
VSHLVIDEMLDHRSCLVIVNIKRYALAIYSACKERLGGIVEPMERAALSASVRVCVLRTDSSP